MSTLVEECMKALNLRKTKSILEMTLEERELYKVCMQVMDNNVIVVDAEPISAERLAEAVKYLKKKQLKFVVLT